MPRDSAGNYSLVSGNPVQSGEVISSSWANNTMDDVGVALTDSLDRNGRGGMLAPFRFADGSNLLPGAAWVNETSTGFYRFDGGDLRVAVLTQDVMRWQTSGVQIWDDTDMQWDNVLTDGGGGSQTPVNVGTADGQTLRWDETTTQEWQATSALIVDDNDRATFTNAQFPTTDVVSTITTATLRFQDTGSVSGVYLGSESDDTVFGTFGVAERMRITSAGNVGIGTTTPLSRLHVTGISNGLLATFGGNNSVATRALQIGEFAVEGINSVGFDFNAPHTTSALSFSTVSTERMRITSAGNVGIGGTPNSDLHVLGVNGGNPIRVKVENNAGGGGTFPFITLDSWGSSASVADFLNAGVLENGQAGGMCYSSFFEGHRWFTSTSRTERMRIDTSGNLLVGTTTTPGGTDGILVAVPSAGSGKCAITSWSQDTSTTGSVFQRFRLSNGTASGLIQSQGASAAAFAAFSDIALKENVADYSGALAEINALHPVTFNWKDSGEVGVGFIAQEVETVYPENVSQDGEYKTVADMSPMTARLVKAIQELTARLEVLENG